MSNSLILTRRYARDVKRQKTHPAVITELMEYITATCPVKSGSRSLTFHQYITDDALYQGYITTVMAPVCFNMFMKIKSWLRVKHSGKYFGMFDCHHCFRLQQLPSLLAAHLPFSAEHERLSLEFAEYQKHREVNLHNAISTF